MPGQVLVAAEHPDSGAGFGRHVWNGCGSDRLLQVDRVKVWPLPGEPQSSRLTRGMPIRPMQRRLVDLHPITEPVQYLHLRLLQLLS